MKSDKLALFGGPKLISKPFKRYNPFGLEEVNAAKAVIETGVLSKYLAKWGDDFLGGPMVKKFEADWERKFNVKHAITVNSWTSGLVCAVGAIGVEPGDEIILPPWTMSATAMAILHWNAIPVFADIDPITYCIDPISIEKNISSRTKAIMAVDIGGQSADMNIINSLAKKYNLKVICDTAQAPGALFEDNYAGTLSDIGGYSLNYHKHIHTGEGGVLVTNNDDLAKKMRLIRNHAEAVIGDMGYEDLTNMIGHNFRLGEIESSIGIEQLKKLDKLIKSRQNIAKKLDEGLKDLVGLNLPKTRENCTHVYYMYFMNLDIDKLGGAKRENIFKALDAEGLKGISLKFANVHLLPIFQKKQAYGSNGFPWNSSFTRNDITYKKGICPVAESLHDENYLGFQMCMYEMTDYEIDLMILTFKKVWKNLSVLR
ncbi:DegT/DnrJ/EryC1/StrS family aminotransferase [Flavobacteriaceae bacterium]|nr:DegT/DnrJ/EryC1/StrS family aminotransferase [Flavobacteriaceae bacterium]